MAITTTWAIKNMTHIDADGGVIQAYWSLVGESDVDPFYSASNQSKAFFIYDASAPGYIPYADLTENDVLGWVWDGLATDGQTSAEAKAAQEANVVSLVEKQIDDAATQTTGVPWS